MKQLLKWELFNFAKVVHKKVKDFYIMLFLGHWFVMYFYGFGLCKSGSNCMRGFAKKIDCTPPPPPPLSTLYLFLFSWK